MRAQLSLFPPPGDLPNPGISPESPGVSCIVRHILLLLSHLGSPKQSQARSYKVIKMNRHCRNATSYINGAEVWIGVIRVSYSHFTLLNTCNEDMNTTLILGQYVQVVYKF